MAEGFEIAQGYVSVVAEVDKDSISRSASRAGKSAGDAITQMTTKSVAGGGSSIAGAMSFAGAPVILAAAGVGALAAPALMAGLSGGIMMGASAGVIGLGYALLKEEPAVKKAAENMGKDITTSFKMAAKPMMKPLIEGMNKFTEIVTGDNIFPKMKEMFTGAGKAIVPLTEGLGVMLEEAMPGLTEMVNMGSQMMTEVAPAFAEIGEGISIFGKEIAKAGPDATVFFKDFISFVGWSIGAMGTFIGWIARGYGELRAFFVGIPPFISSAVAWFKNLGSSIAAWASSVGAWFSGAYASVTGFFSSIGSAISGFVSRAGAWFASLPGRIGGALASLWASIAAWGASVGAWFSALPGRIGSFLAALPGVLRTAFTTAMHAALFAVGFAIGSIIKFFIQLPGRVRAGLTAFISTVVSTFTSARARAVSLALALVTGAVNFLRTLPGRARSAINALISNVVSVFTSARARASSTASSLVSSAVNFFRQLPGRARSAISSLIGNVSSVFSSAAASARSGASNLVNGAINFIRQLPGRVRSALGGVRGSVTGAFSGAGGWLVGAGRNIISGLISGIRSMIGAAVGAAISGMRSVIAGAKSALGIASPSKVFANEVGKWIMPGVAQGVKKGVGPARRTVADATRSLLPAVSAGRSGAQASVTTAAGNTYHFAPGAITLDASGLRSIEDVINLIGGIRSTARSRHARTAAPAGA